MGAVARKLIECCYPPPPRDHQIQSLDDLVSGTIQKSKFCKHSDEVVLYSRDEANERYLEVMAELEAVCGGDPLVLMCDPQRFEAEQCYHYRTIFANFYFMLQLGPAFSYTAPRVYKVWRDYYTKTGRTLWAGWERLTLDQRYELVRLDADAYREIFQVDESFIRVAITSLIAPKGDWYENQHYLTADDYLVLFSTVVDWSSESKKILIDLYTGDSREHCGLCVLFRYAPELRHFISTVENLQKDVVVRELLLTYDHELLTQQFLRETLWHMQDELKTALQRAVKSMRLEFVNAMLPYWKGGCLDVEGSSFTLLHYAKHHESEDLFKLVKPYSDVRTFNKSELLVGLAATQMGGFMDSLHVRVDGTKYHFSYNSADDFELVRMADDTAYFIYNVTLGSDGSKTCGGAMHTYDLKNIKRFQSLSVKSGGRDRLAVKDVAKGQRLERMLPFTYHLYNGTELQVIHFSQRAYVRFSFKEGGREATWYGDQAGIIDSKTNHGYMYIEDMSEVLDRHPPVTEKLLQSHGFVQVVEGQNVWHHPHLGDEKYYLYDGDKIYKGVVATVPLPLTLTEPPSIQDDRCVRYTGAIRWESMNVISVSPDFRRKTIASILMSDDGENVIEVLL